MDETSFESVDIDYTPDNLVESDNFLTEEEDYFLQQLEAIGVKEVFPNFTYLGVEYDSLRPIKDFYTEEEMHLLLESLAKKGYLKEFNLGTVLLCPECNSPVVMITLICGDCGSTKVKKVDVIEHLECGYQGEESQFLTGKTMTCPLCGESLENHNTGKKYRVVNSKYYCDSCGNVIDKARTVLHCLKCKNKFKHGEAIRRNPKGYVVDDYNHDRELRDNYLVDVTDDENPATEIETHLIEPDNEAQSTNKQEKKEKVDDGKKETYEITVSSEDTLTDIVDTDGVTISSKFNDVSFMNSSINGLDLPSFNFQLPKIELSKINLPSVSLSTLLSRLSGWKDETRKTSTEIETNVTVSEIKQEITEHTMNGVDPNPEVNILLIEDQKVHADLILGSLGGSNNLKVVHAESGKNGLKQLRRKYDVVIVDTSLNDVEANIILSEMEKWKVDTPVILLSEDVKSQTVSIAGEAHILDRTLVSYKSLPRVINNLPIKPSDK